MKIISNKSEKNIVPSTKNKSCAENAPPSKSSEMSNLMKAHLEEIAGGITGHGSWRSTD